MKEKKDHTLISCNLPTKQKAISIIYRQSSIREAEVWYYEGIVWEYDPISRERKDIIHMDDCGGSETRAFAKFNDWLQRCIEDLPFKEED